LKREKSSYKSLEAVVMISSFNPIIHSLMKKALSFMVPFVCLKKKVMGQPEKYITLYLTPPRKLVEVNLSK
jgi:hypothetical protein